ncbi:MAG: tRNA pseudouridine(55) synthase TruB [Microbacteriaceae bacterium]|nr:tRNA pseudouridine(55) synthase TruB [Microbacteriaceae bacterium]
MTGVSGILLIDKPAGITSHDAVSHTRKAAGTRKVGHAGTLDPMATGLLVLGINSATRLLTYVVGLDKEYFATIRLGSATSTDDREGDETFRANPETVAAISIGDIARQINRLTGDIDQTPSSVSAIKVDGKRAYALARAGETVVLAARSVTVAEFELLGEPIPIDGHLDFLVRVSCSSGTYIRALARDIGLALGVGGHLTELRRTRIGPFRVTDAAVLENLDVAAELLHPATVAQQLFDAVTVDQTQALELSQGKRIELSAELATGAAILRPAPSIAAPDPHLGPYAAISPSGRLVGLLEIKGGRTRTLVNFPPDDATNQCGTEPVPELDSGVFVSADAPKPAPA